jgi:crotonobetainyl-CoA:carnitine CoA-transferase CaiB-like acyl-CoA transferase
VFDSSRNGAEGTSGGLLGLRVLDLTGYIAGPYCTKLLACCGADVIKVEHPDGGDPMRRCGPFDADGESIEFRDLNLGKRSVRFDLRRDRDAVLELAAGADVVVEAFRPGTLDGFGLGYRALREVNPRIVLSSISSFGQTGPYRDVVATEIVLYAMGGEMYGTGQPDLEPTRLAPGVALRFAGEAAVVPTLAAALHGQGDWVDVSIMETLLASPDRRMQSLTAYAYCGEKKMRESSLGVGNPPEYLHCGDGWIHMTAPATAWPQVAKLIGEDEAAPAAEIREAWLKWSGARPKLEVVETLQAAGLPAMPVNSIAELIDEQHFAERDFFQEVDGHRHVGVFARFADTPASLPGPAPGLGQHDGQTWLDSTIARPEPPAEAPPGTLPLAGVRTIDLGVVLAGPLASMALGDLGAEVVRVESTRRFPASTRGFLAHPTKEFLAKLPPLGGGYPNRDPGEHPWNRFPLFNMTARNKLGATIDTREDEGREAFLTLVAKCDVLISTQTPGTLDKLGIGWDACRAVNDQLVFIDATSFGATGSKRLWRGYGTEMEAFAGHDLLRRYRGRDVGSNSWSVSADASGALAMAVCALVGLYARRRTGRGQYVDVSMVENFLGLIGGLVLEYTSTGRMLEALGNRDREAVQGAYQCTGDDRWLVLTIRDDDDWAGMLRATGWAPEERFATPDARYAHHDELDEMISAWTRSRSREEAVDRLRREGVPAGPVIDDADAYVDPHLHDRGYFWEVTQVDCGTHRYPGPAFRLASVGLTARLPPVRLGEHNEYVWRELIGVTEETYSRLEAEGHIGTEFAATIR